MSVMQGGQQWTGFQAGNQFTPGRGQGEYTPNVVSVLDPDVKAQMAMQGQQLASKNQHFNQAFGLLSGQLGSFGSSVGGASQQGPHINAGPVWNPAQMQQNINANKAQGDQATAGQVQQMQSSMAGKGWGANSPLAAAMENQMHMANTANTTDYARNFTQQARQTNAQQVLAGQTAQEQQTANRNNEDIERRRTVAGSMNALIGALGSMI